MSDTVSPVSTRSAALDRARARFRRTGARVRLFVVRRPWIRWSIVAAGALLVAGAVQARLDALDAARLEWADRVEVRVATEPARPGEPIVWEWRTLPPAAVPDAAIDHLEPDTIAVRDISPGSVIVSHDAAFGAGPAGTADPGEIVVAVDDPLIGRTDVGLHVAIFSDGVVVADSARIASVDGEVAYVAVDADDAPVVAAAAQRHTASIGFLRPENAGPGGS